MTHRSTPPAWLALAFAAATLSACESMGLEGSTPADTGAAAVAEAAGPYPRIIDLTQPLSPDAPYFPGGVGFRVRMLADIESGYYSRGFSMGEHTGTHVDAPGHFVKGQGLMESIAAGDLIAPLVVIDVRAQCAENPDYTLDRATLLAWEQQHGPVPRGAVVALLTGWADRAGDLARYRNADADGVMHFPGFSADVSEFLATTRDVRAVGIDTLSTDPGNSTDFAQHKTFLAHGKYQIENLRNLERVPPTGATIVVGALPIQLGSGAPARVLAIVPAPGN